MSKKDNKIEKDYWIKYNIGPEILPYDHLIIDIIKAPNAKIDFCLEPVNILTSKENKDLFFRTFSFVDKFHLWKLKELIENKKEKIIKYLIIEQSNSEKVSQYSIIEGNEFINFIELKSLGFDPPKKSYFQNSLTEVSRGSGFIFNKSIDISRFYDSIYSHSIEWTILGKKELNFAKKIDTHIRDINGKITNGIPTGPIVSKIVSEIILTSIMNELNDKLNDKLNNELKDMNVHIHRFADDFTIYYNSENEFIKVAKLIASLLNKYKLAINKEKMENNYTYQKNALQRVSTYQVDDDKWTLLYGEIVMKNFKTKKTIIRLTKLLSNAVTGIKEQREKTSFYRWTLKSFSNNEFELLINDKNLSFQKYKDFITLIFNFAINYIVTSDLGLNIPLKFLKILFKIDVISKELEKLKIEFIKKIRIILKNVTSEMKKIFLLDLLIKVKKEKIDYIDDSYLKKCIDDNHLLHIAQLLEAEIIEFNKFMKFNKNDKNEVKIPFPSYNEHKRLSKEWVVWMYIEKNELNKYEEKSMCKLKEIIKYKNFFKPFDYSNHFSKD